MFGKSTQNSVLGDSGGGNHGLKDLIWMTFASMLRDSRGVRKSPFALLFKAKRKGTFALQTLRVQQKNVETWSIISPLRVLSMIEVRLLQIVDELKKQMPLMILFLRRYNAHLTFPLRVVLQCIALV